MFQSYSCCFTDVDSLSQSELSCAGCRLAAVRPLTPPVAGPDTQTQNRIHDFNREPSRTSGDRVGARRQDGDIMFAVLDERKPCCWLHLASGHELLHTDSTHNVCRLVGSR